MDLNKKMWSKDLFPLPHVDIIVNATVGHEMLSSMDEFTGYS